jgi:ribulose-5-phosphate 4-epimerase/fuculose-1-phosphate aldolase
LVAGLDGNVSARLDDGTFLATPTASHLGVIEPHDLLMPRATEIARMSEPYFTPIPFMWSPVP